MWGCLLRGAATGRCCIECEASTCGIPFFCFVLFLWVLFFDVVRLLVLDSVLVFGLLSCPSDAGSKGPEEWGCVHC
jgi:hypothetical protein